MNPTATRRAPIRIGVRDTTLGRSLGAQILELLRPHLGAATFAAVPIASDEIRGGRPWPGAALERALVEERVDLLVQNAKDVPPAAPAGIVRAAVTERFTPFDVLIAGEGLILDELPEGSTLSAHTALRRAQLLHYRSDLEILHFGGSLEERLDLLERGVVDGLVVSASAVEHLHLQEKVTEVFTTEVLVPAGGQGCCVLEARVGDRDLVRLARHLDHPIARPEYEMESAFLRELKAGPDTPVGALASARDGYLRLEGVIADREGLRVYRDVEEGEEGDETQVGARLARKLLLAGGRRALSSTASDPT